MGPNHKLKNFRENLKKSKEDIAKDLKVSASFYEKIEKGERNPSFNFIRKFKSSFPETDIDYIFFDIQLHSKCIKETIT